MEKSNEAVRSIPAHCKNIFVQTSVKQPVVSEQRKCLAAGKPILELTDEEIIQETLAETAGLLPEREQPILGSWNEFAQDLFKPRPDIEYIYEGLIPKGVEGGLFASGGTGKTFFCIQQVLYGAAGLPFGRLKPTRPLKAVFLCAEDPKRFLLDRAENIIRANHLLNDHLELIKKNANIKSLTSELASFLQLDNNGNIAYTPFFNGILKELQLWQDLDLIILDPLMSFWGLAENESASGHALIGGLRKIAAETGATIQVSHHVSKSATIESICTGGGRGTSAIYDGLRYAFGMTKILPTINGHKGNNSVNPELKNLQKKVGDNQASFAKFFSAKSNHSAELCGHLYFRRGSGGVLEPFETIDFSEDAKFTLLELIKERNHSLSINDICKQASGAAIRGRMKINYSLTGDLLKGLLKELITEGRLLESEPVKSGPGAGKTALQVAKTECLQTLF